MIVGLIGLLLLWWWPLGLGAQQVTVFEPPVFAADAYATTAPDVVPGHGTAFFYLQELYKHRDRRWSGTWLVQVRPKPPQRYGQTAESLELLTQTPVDAPHAQRPTHLRLLRLAKSLAVVGRLPDPHFAGPRVVVQFFDLNGKALGPLQTLSCYYNERADGWWDTLLVAAQGERLIWWGENRHEPPARRRTFVSVFADGGRLQWQHEVHWPNGGHSLRHLTTDRHNTLYLLLEPTTPLSTHRLLAYEPRNRQFAVADLDWPAPVAWQTALALDARGLPVVGAVLGHSVDLGLRNGSSEGWVAWGLQRFALENDRFRRLDQLIEPLSDTLRERYCRGANFHLESFCIEGDLLLWSWAEPHDDLLTLAFDLEEQGPRLRWAAALFRRQGGLLVPANQASAYVRLYTEATDPFGTFRFWVVDRNTGRARRLRLQTSWPLGFRLAGSATLTEAHTLVLPLEPTKPEASYRLLQLAQLP